MENMVFDNNVGGQPEHVKEESLPVWISDERSQMAMRSIKAITFQYDPKTRVQYTSPFISEYVAGNYDGRLLSTVMLDDGVIHQDDIFTSIQFRDQAASGKTGSMTIRLKIPSGDYHWFTMTISTCTTSGVAVGTLVDVDNDVRHTELLRYRAEYDPISSIYNKATFFTMAQQILNEEKQKQRTLIRFDIDRFKIINELYGMSEGDKVLRYIGKIVQGLSGAGETFARMGDDVFCMLLNRSEQETIDLINLLEYHINEYPLAFQFVISVGIVRIPKYMGVPVNILCDRAAMAQRTVKGSYTRCYAFYEDWMGEALSREHQITGYMRKALEERQFQVYLQPKYNMTTNKIIGAEALARWKHPVEGMIMPGDFIPLFERNGFITHLDEYIWDNVGQLMRKWMDQGLPVVPVSINVSRMHLHNPNVCDIIFGISERYQIPRGFIEIEITESAYIETPQMLYSIMDILQGAGYKVMMDDFGSGYSSLNMLKDISVDTIKIDLNFLKDARRNNQIGKNVLQGIVQLMKNIEMPVIIEGVETKEQVDYLTGIGCNFAQGYYYAKPMPVEEFEILLGKQ